MAARTALPTLSQVQTLDTAYLREAAQYWTRSGNLWEQALAEVHERMATPGGVPWKGQAAAAAQERAYVDLVKVREASDRLHGAAVIALRGDQQLQACKEAVQEAVQDARADGFDVGEDYSVTDRSRGGSSEFRAARLAAAQGHASFIRHRVAALLASDHQLSTQISAATKDIDALTFHEEPSDTIIGDKRNRVQAVDRHTFKDAPNPEPDPPPGGWSSDPLMRAAQRIAYGHALKDHAGDFPGMSKDQLADLIYSKMKRSIENPDGLRLGASRSDGAPVIYDPKDNVLIIRDPQGSDCGTVFKPNLTKDPEVVNNKFGWHEPSFKPGQLVDQPPAAPAEPRLAPPPAAGEPAPAKSPVSPPVEAPPVKSSPGTGEGGGGTPGLRFGGGLPWDAPGTGPHVVNPHKPGQHHRAPLLGELPDDYDG
jgi:hypothetical protein